MSIINPTFEIDEKGRVICQMHTKFPFFVMPGKIETQEIQMEKELTCLTCNHYKNDECFFPKTEIDKIEVDRLGMIAFKCKLCGSQIDRMLTIIQKLYLQEKFSIEIPLICCACYESLKNKNFIEFHEKRLYLAYFLNASIIIGFILSLLMIRSPTSIISGIIYATSIISLKEILKKAFRINLSVRDIRNGKKYFDKFYKDSI